LQKVITFPYPELPGQVRWVWSQPPIQHPKWCTKIFFF